MKHMNMKRTNFYFPDQMLERLKKVKEKTGLTVSEIMRNAVEKYLKEIEL